MKKVIISKELAETIKLIRTDEWIPISSKFDNQFNKDLMQKVMLHSDSSTDIVTLARAIQEGYIVREYMDLSRILTYPEGTVVEHESNFYSDTNFVIEFDSSDGGKYLTFGNKSVSDGATVPLTEIMLIPKWYVVKEV